MKTIILCGGFGTRISEYTGTIPKPMITVGGKPLLWHIMKIYAYYGKKDFILALGYKAEVIKEYFLNYNVLNSNFKVELASGKTSLISSGSVDWSVTLVDTGVNTMTGGRVKRLKDFVGDDTFLLTYGDGVADIEIDKLLEFHRKHGKMITVTAVRPSARFGELELDSFSVKRFQEKPQLKEGWINGGFFVIEPSFLDLIADDSTLLEREPLEQAVDMKQVVAFKHDGFWQCMDTKRDHEALESMWINGAPWCTW
jgi:glucose-1-phosphate cytidylyltransferase